MLHRVSSQLSLFRPLNCLALSALFLALAWHQAAGGNGAVLLLRAASWLLVSAFAYTLNDLLDVEIDRVNHPSRALVTGAVSMRCGKLIIVGLGISAVVSSVIAWRGQFPWPLGALLGSVIYSMFLRRRSAVLSNMLCGSLVALVPMSAITDWTWPGVSLVLGLFWMTLAREAQKDIGDRGGDALARPRPLRDVLGDRFGPAYKGLLVVAAACLLGAFAGSLIGLGAGVLIVAPLTIALRAKHLDSCDRQAALLKLSSYLVVLAVLAKSIN